MDPVVSAPALLAAVVLRLAQRPVHLLEGGQKEAEVTPGGSKWTSHLSHIWIGNINILVQPRYLVSLNLVKVEAKAATHVGTESLSFTAVWHSTLPQETIKLVASRGRKHAKGELA